VNTDSSLKSSVLFKQWEQLALVSHVKLSQQGRTKYMFLVLVTGLLISLVEAVVMPQEKGKVVQVSQNTTRYLQPAALTMGMIRVATKRV